MRLLLISPADIDKFYYGQPRYYSDNMAAFPPLSLLPLVSYLKKNTRHTVRVLDMELLKCSCYDLEREILNFLPDVIGITCMINKWYAIVQILNFIKTKFPHIRTVLGGYNTTEFPSETLTHKCVDYIILGTGQEPLKNLLDYLESGKINFSEIRGLFPRDSLKRDFSSERERVDPDLFPFPDRACVPFKKYRSAISQRFPSTVMISSDGCPYQCNFCNTSNMKKIIIRDPLKVVDEMSECADLGIKEIMFQDELFTINQDRVIKICQEIISRNLDIVWNFKSRINSISEEMLPFLKKAGCSSIHFGVENGNDEILEKMNKGITTAQVRKVFKLLKKFRIEGSASFMLAYPTETFEQIKNTVDFAIEIDASFAQFTLTCDFPGTKIYLENLRNGKYPFDIWKDFVLHPRKDFIPPYSSDLFKEAQLRWFLDYAYRRFYRRMGYVGKKIMSIKSFSQFVNQFSIAKDLWLQKK